MNDDVLRGLFTDVADQAHDPVALAPAILTRARVRRQRRGLLAAAGTTAVLGAATSAVWPRPRDGAPAPAIATPSSAVPSPSIPDPRVRMKYRPSWLPKGFVEVSRIAGPVSQTRSFRRGGPESLELIHLFLDAGPEPRGKRTTLGGRTAWLTRNPDDQTQVTLDVGDGRKLGIAVVDAQDRAEIARHVAAKIVEDGSAVAEISLGFGWYPERFSRGAPEVSIDGTRNSWTEVLRLKDGGRMLFEVELGADHPRPDGGERSTLRGRPAWVYEGGLADPSCPPSTPEQEITCGVSTAQTRVELGRGRILSLRQGAEDLAVDEMKRIVTELRLGPAPDTSWLPG
ncbi:hypothetical protein FB565_000901 [Actinoplanes lutulentus]|uniref:Uncharacterized protein n=1 Tax=Actinoplanes lutulentus TaxID=1287878 RepID=A0A327ZMJ4_9ACTN|nr:hypothetical protein [Actinoplanes lutulentus]MBB2941197.1 hypothetical protein [Actinoplanes lutulentus]RAK43506.1 hypothetical protein B0I29_101636 [Actinoplanes lutulentus]